MNARAGANLKCHFRRGVSENEAKTQYVTDFNRDVLPIGT